MISWYNVHNVKVGALRKFTKVTCCNYKFYEGVNAFYKSESYNYINSDILCVIIL